jgi:hypothetical protein
MSKKRIANYVFQPGVSSASNAYPNAYSLLNANIDFIKKEANAYIAQQIIVDSANNLYPNAVTLLTNNKQFIIDEVSAWTTAQVSAASVGGTFYNYVYGTTEIAKCKRDMGYLIDALIYDLRYGGNERLVFIASQYYLSGVIQVIAPAVEVAIQTRLWNIIIGFVLNAITLNPVSVGNTQTQSTTGGAAEAAAITLLSGRQNTISNVINGGLSTLPTTVYSAFNFPGYTYDGPKCERDIGYVVKAYIHDLRYGGNTRTRLMSSKYWNGEIPQVDGDRKPEIATHTFIRDLVNNVIFDGGKCARDIGYLLDGVKYDVALGTNYNQVFLGLTEYNSLEVSSNVIAKIQAAGTAASNLSAVVSDTTATNRLNAFFAEVVNIAQNGRAAADPLVFPNPTSGATASQIAAKDKIIANRDFLAAEVNAWVAATYPSADHDPAKCIRDVHYAVDAICYDILYDGNSATYAQSKFFFYSFADGHPGILASHKAVTVAAYGRLKTIIGQVVQGQTVAKTTTGSSPNIETQTTTGNNANAGTATACQALVQITADVIASGSKAAALAYLASIDETYPDVTWATTGLRAAKTAIETNKSSIINLVTSYTPLQNIEPIVLLNGIAGEAGSRGRITTLANVITTVIQNGLGSLPAVQNGVTTIRLQGYYPLDKLLLITNSVNNQIIYNFSDGNLGATATFDSPHNSNGVDLDEDFPAFINTTDYVTVLELRADTSTCSSTDDIQIFIESEEQKTRPYDFGTDAIERMRVAPPQSMLDADFEYGLQPTKWQAIGVARGYPSVYELPGSDTSVVTVVTDASAATASIGQSTITVTTAGAHGFIPGTPITIRALANTISGFSRAEGTFIVISVPTPTSFTYFSTAKVGTQNGQVLATTYTQLRKGAFYTGAAIGQPVLSVFTNGISGSFTTKYITTSGTDQIAVTGALPALGAPITATGINPGTQVTGTVGTGGIVTANVSIPAAIGDTSITFVDSSGIIEGMGINNGTGTAVFVSGILGNTVTFTQPLTAVKGGASQTYLNKTGTNIIPAGTGAVFSVDRVAGNYTNITVTTPGVNYVVNSRIKLLGSDLGGVAGVNDLILKIDSVTNLDTFTNISGTASASGTSAAFDILISPTNTYSQTIRSDGTGYAVGETITLLGTSLGGTAPTNNATVTVTTVTQTYTSVAQTSATGTPGTGARFTVVRTGAVYAVTVTTPGSGYTPGDVITIAGTSLGGATPANNLTITVVDVNLTNGINLFNNLTGTGAGVGSIYAATITGTGNFVGGLISAVSTVSGNSISGERSYSALAFNTTSASGTAATFDVNTLSGTYDVVINNPGSTFSFGEIIKIYGTQLGGTTPGNDLTLTVTSVNSFGGGILAFNTSGTPSSTDATFTSLSATKIAPGTGASFDIVRAGGSYTTAVPNLPGSGYEINDKILFAGANFDGVTPTNNVTVTVTSTAAGIVTSATASGTAVLGAAIDFYSAVSLSELTTASIADATSISTSAIATLQLTFPSAHGLVPGATILVDVTSAGTNHDLAKGPFYVESVPSSNVIRYTARTTGTIDTAVNLIGTIYSRPDSYFIHRPYDGGVQLSTGGPAHGAQAIRMSKKYIRYQSGKGIMYTTGALFAPSYSLQSASASGTTVGSYITFTTDDVDHGCQVGGKVRITGIDTAGYNGEYVISDIITERIFKVQATTTLASVYATITTAAQISILAWHGATVRAGTYDDQNGMFWQYDGSQLAVGRRTSTLQLSGVASIAKDSNILTGVNTRFRDQIKAGDRIVIKGMTHVVSNVYSQTSMTVTPDYRGANNCVSGKICLVQDIIIPQNKFNLDRLDGTGPSGYNLDITKMQMIGMQWSWYGAGFIDYMLRGSDGNYVFCHRIRNSNVNTEAYMRTGNMPVRYEVINEGATGKLRQSVNATQTTLPLYDASAFPNESGVVYVDNELVLFTGKVGNTLVGCTRSGPITNFVGGAQRTFRAGTASVHEVNTGVILVSNTITPIISHWGSAMITDGRFDEDRGYLFNYASTGIQVSTTKQTAFLIRLAPSVSNAIIGDLGDRELINRAQLLLKAIEVTSDSGTGGLVVEGILNPQNYPVDPAAISWSGLAGSSAGGQPSFAQVAPGGSVSWAGGASTATSTATTTAALTGTATVPANTAFASASGSNVLYVTKDSWDTLGATAGFSVAASETKYPSGTTVSTITANPSPIATTLGLITGTATVPNNIGFAQGGGATASVCSISGTTLTVSGVISGYISSNTTITGGTTAVNTRITAQLTGTSGGAGTYQVSISQNVATFAGTISGSNVLFVTQTSWLALNGIVTSAVYSADYPAGTTVTAVSGPAVAFGASYYTLTMSQNATTAHAANSTTTFSVTGQANSNATTLNFTQSSWNGLPIGSAVVGNTVNDTGKFANGTSISNISTVQTFAGVNYYTVTFNTGLLAAQAASVGVTFTFTPYYTLVLSKAAISTISAAATVAFTPAVIATNTSFLYFTKASWETLVATYGATAGTEVVDPTKFPSGTKVASIGTLASFAGTQYYRVNFTQSSIIAIANASTITFQFGLPPYALPGETVFSFIAAPGTTSSLDLSELKELTNTTLGGRGTYPNGPDVLAINVYRASGVGSIPTNLIVRWGEAQA